MLNTIVLGAVFGLIAPLVLPMLFKPTTHAARVGNAYGAFVMKALKRPGLGVGKHGDVNLRQLSFDQIYDQEVVEVDGVEKKITRSAKNVHRFGKTPFTFFDEVFGVTFDLRDVHIGQLERQHRDDGEMVYEHAEYDENGEPKRFEEYVRAFFELDGRRGLDLDLDESVRPITDGSERAGWWNHMYEAVKRMYIHRQEDTSIMRMLIPFIVGGAAFLGGYYVLGPGQMPGSPTGGADPIPVGAALGLTLPAVNVPAWARKVVIALAGTAVLAGLAVAFGPVTFAIGAVAFLVGAAVLPLLTTVLGALGYGVGLADLILWAGLQAFDEPVVDLTEDNQYRLVEADDIDLENPPKVRLSKTLVGLSCAVSADAFGRAGYTGSDLVDYLPDSEFLADGGQNAVPRGYTITDGIQNGGLRGFMPNKDEIASSVTYVRTDNWLSRFKNAATGDTLDVAETEATNEFADGDSGLSDGQIMKYSALSAAVGLGFWVVVAVAF